jgi:hypothetical protein
VTLAMVLLFGSLICAAGWLVVHRRLAQRLLVHHRPVQRGAGRPGGRPDDGDGVRECLTTPRPRLPLATNDLPSPAVDLASPTGWVSSDPATIRPQAATIARSSTNTSASSRFTRRSAGGPAARPTRRAVSVSAADPYRRMSGA